jgi:signal transduction histidine kinase
MKKMFFFLFVSWIQNSAFCADTVINYNGSDRKVNIGNQVEVLEDKTGELSLSEAVHAENYFIPELQVPNLGVGKSVFWIRIRIKNTSGDENLLLQLAYPIMDEVVFFHPTENDSDFIITRSGDNFPFHERKYNHQNFIFDIHVPKQETKTFYLKVRSGEQIILPITIGTQQFVFENNLSKDILFGIYFGVILAMFLYNLFIYFIVRDRTYLYYVTYVLFISLTQAGLQGYTFKFLWPSSAWFANHSITLFPAIAGIATVGFIRSFLQSRTITPKLDKGLYVIVFIYCLALVANFILNNQNLSYNLIDLDASLISLYALIIAIVIASKGYRSAKFFLLGWTVFLVGVIGFVLKNLDVLPDNNFTDYTMSAGTILEVLLFSFALADRINVLRKEKEESQWKVLEALKENERIIAEQNIILDAKVKDRTRELESSNRNLKDAQVQLVNAEKMASLGQLTAGIAHEINNPINFVIGNVYPLKRDIQDILALLAKYYDIQDGKDLDEKLNGIKNLKKEIDADYLIQEMDLLLKGIEEGASRTSEIVKGLQNFSRLEEDGLKKADIHKGIDATLLLLNSNLNKEKIKVIKEYGDFGEIECYPGKLNQVFMNILNNAIYALQNTDQDNREIRINTSKTETAVRISIKDNGHGIPEVVKDRIFEPFFTTKNIGEGSGLGLSIVYGIIEKHKGKIEVVSEEGKGTEFIILLPVQ